MATIELAPYFHPTQIVLVDDDIDFLGNLSLQLDADLAYLLFDSTHKALGYLNGRQPNGTARDRFFKAVPNGHGDSGKNHRESLALDISALHREMQASDRFAQISVALVDYAMPQMNGLEFCRQIKDPHVKKILFTGVATESVAVDAFNHGIIDQYIRKHEHAVYDTLNQAIRQFQQEYIRDVFTAAADVFPVDLPGLLKEPAVARLIERLRADQGLVEYYLAVEPTGFVFADAAGQVKRVVIQSRDERAHEAQRARAAGAPAAIVDGLEAGTLMLDPNSSVYHELDWSAHTAPGAELGDAAGDLRWSLFDMSCTGGGIQARPSYNEFLEWLDTVGYSLM
ncbi:response regulator [Salinisphaera sp. LB1]|uniref:response regulator n=1 Tax=Salinisphaera sp. LB1 TaxID=2183911 RepID=UPI000D70832D|nr:response regulator [Salinisphaera sp. LB1]AWN17384.1 CheY-like receiver protein [Salinisphaera sp. LB1]